ncbi:MAG: hypothetical protein AB7V77_04640 [Candidatus Woesearchaeota archaeon]
MADKKDGESKSKVIPKDVWNKKSSKDEPYKLSKDALKRYNTIHEKFSYFNKLEDTTHLRASKALIKTYENMLSDKQGNVQHELLDTGGIVYKNGKEVKMSREDLIKDVTEEFMKNLKKEYDTLLKSKVVKDAKDIVGEEQAELMLKGITTLDPYMIQQYLTQLGSNFNESELRRYTSRQVKENTRAQREYVARDLKVKDVKHMLHYMKQHPKYLDYTGKIFTHDKEGNALMMDEHARELAIGLFSKDQEFQESLKRKKYFSGNIENLSEAYKKDEIIQYRKSA